MSAATCSLCGKVEDPPPPTWSLAPTERGSEWLCEKCTRDNIRGIEGRLDADWW